MENIFDRVKRYTKDSLCVAVSGIRTFDPKENIILFSDPRGGSTWLTESIARLPKTAILWEPLHLMHTPNFKKVNFGWRQFIPEMEIWDDARMEFERLFKGKALNYWTCNLSSPFRFLTADRMIVKFCRANALIPWLTKEFRFSYDPVYLVRHPFAVAASQLIHGAWSFSYSGFEIPNVPFNKHYTDHSDFLSQLKTKEEALVATWCLTNLVPLCHSRNDKSWITIYYENLIRYPEKECYRIFQRWGLPIPYGIQSQLKEPSTTTKDATNLSDFDKQCGKWRSFFDQKQISKMTEILRYFEVKDYSADDIFPNDQRQTSK